MKFRPNQTNYEDECRRLKGQIAAMHTKLQSQQRLLDRLITHVERQTGGIHFGNGRFSRSHIETFTLPHFVICDSGKVVEYDAGETWV